VVDAVPEREVTRISPVDVKDLRVGVPVSVPVGGGQADDDLGPGGDYRITDLYRFGRVTEGRVRDRRVVAQELLDGRRDLAGVRAQPRQLCRVAQQGDDAVAEQAGGGVVSGRCSGTFDEVFDLVQGCAYRLLAAPVAVAHEHVLSQPRGEGQPDDLE
jgi:hypothetical protein